MSDSVCLRKRGGAQGACPAMTLTENVPCEVCPGCENCRWRDLNKNKYIKPIVNILSERNLSHALNSGEVYDDQGELEVQLSNWRHLETALLGC